MTKYMMDMDEKIENARDDLERTQSQRKAERERHESAMGGYRVRIQEIERKLEHAFRNTRVHGYVDEIRCNNSQSPYVIQRQAIMCSVLHNLEFTGRQTALIQRQHQENVDRMITAEFGIEDDWAKRTKLLSLAIANAIIELKLLESLLIKNSIENKKHIMADEAGCLIGLTGTTSGGLERGEMALLLPVGTQGKNHETSGGWMTQLQRSLPDLSAVFDLRQPEGCKLVKHAAEGA